MANTTRRQFKARMNAKQDVLRAIPALMGDGNGTVEVPGQPGFVYIRVGDGDLGQAFNNRCPLADNLAIYVGYDPITDPDRRIFQVLSVRMADYAAGGNQNIYPNVANHHAMHEYGGGDDVYLSWRRLMGLRVGRPAAFVVTVDSGYLYHTGAWAEIAATTVDLTAEHTALVGVQAQYTLISLSSAGVVTHTNGTPVISPATLTIADCPTPPAGHIPLAAVRLYKMQTAIGDVPTAPDIVDLRFPTYNTMSGYVTPHNVLSASHGDSLAGAVVDGDVIIGNVTPRWSRLAIAIPAANVRNVLGVDNGELRPSWKTALDSTNPTTIAEGAVAAPGTSLVFSHRDHTHGAPATWAATAHNVLDSTYHGDVLTGAVARGDLLYGNATPKIARLALGGAAGSFVRRDAADVLWSTLILPNAATTGDILHATGANTIGNLADVATGSVLASGGIGVIPAWASSPTLTGMTLSGLTASTVIYSDAAKAITSLANGAGVLTNDGAGGLSWGAAAAHALLSATHNDTLADGVVDGDVVIGNVTPRWSRLAISIPAANVRNALGIDNGELRPSWKTTLDATNPTTIGIGDAASPGTSLIYSHRDHQHASPATWTATAHAIDGAIHTVAGRTAGQVLIATGAAAFGWSGFLLTGTAGGTADFSIPNGKTLIFKTTDNYTISVVGNVSFSGGGLASDLALPNAQTTITGGGTIALGTYTFTVPATGTAALLGTANVFTATQTITGVGSRISGDFSNATHASRLLFQSSTTNGNTLVGALPNGTGTTAAFNIYDNSDLSAALAFGQFRVVAATAIDFNSNVLNAGTQLPLTFSIASTAKLTITTAGHTNLAGGLNVGGDSGGLASNNSLTNVSDVSANSTGVGTIKFKGATNRDSTGFIKIYIGTTAYYVPVFSAITG